MTVVEFRREAGGDLHEAAAMGAACAKLEEAGLICPKFTRVRAAPVVGRRETTR